MEELLSHLDGSAQPEGPEHRGTGSSAGTCSHRRLAEDRVLRGTDFHPNRFTLFRTQYMTPGRPGPVDSQTSP